MDARAEPSLQFSFETDVLYWRGPSPFFFAPIPPDHAEELRRISKLVTYGWGMIPVEAEIAGVAFTTSLYPKDDTYLLPIKAAVRRKTEITAGDRIRVDMSVQGVARRG